MAPAQRCPGCGLTSDGREALCGACWTEVPARHRALVRRAQRKVGYNPASVQAQQQMQVAIANAVGAAR